MIEPRCLENHHNDDGTLIVYMGSTKPCLGCKSRDGCFKLFVAYREQKRTTPSQNGIPDMVPIIPYPKCCGTCQNGIPISTTSTMVVCSYDNKQKNENRICRNLYVRASLW